MAAPITKGASNAIAQLQNQLLRKGNHATVSSPGATEANQLIQRLKAESAPNYRSVSERVDTFQKNENATPAIATTPTGASAATPQPEQPYHGMDWLNSSPYADLMNKLVHGRDSLGKVDVHLSTLDKLIGPYDPARPGYVK